VFAAVATPSGFQVTTMTRLCGHRYTTAGAGVPGDDTQWLEYARIPIGLAERIVRKSRAFRSVSRSRGVLRVEVSQKWRSERRRHAVWQRVHTAFPPSLVPRLMASAGVVHETVTQGRKTWNTVPPARAWRLKSPSQRCSLPHAPQWGVAGAGGWKIARPLSGYWGSRRWSCGGADCCSGHLGCLVAPHHWEYIVAKAYWEAVVRNAKWLIQETGEVEQRETERQRLPAILRATAWLDAALEQGSPAAQHPSALKDLGLCYYSLATLAPTMEQILHHPIPGVKRAQSTHSVQRWACFGLRRAAFAWKSYLEHANSQDDDALPHIRAAYNFAVERSGSC